MISIQTCSIFIFWSNRTAMRISIFLVSLLIVTSDKVCQASSKWALAKATAIYQTAKKLHFPVSCPRRKLSLDAKLVDPIVDVVFFLRQHLNSRGEFCFRYGRFVFFSMYTADFLSHLSRGFGAASESNLHFFSTICFFFNKFHAGACCCWRAKLLRQLIILVMNSPSVNDVSRWILESWVCCYKFERLHLCKTLLHCLITWWMEMTQRERIMVLITDLKTETSWFVYTAKITIDFFLRNKTKSWWWSVFDDFTKISKKCITRSESKIYGVHGQLNIAHNCREDEPDFRADENG